MSKSYQNIENNIYEQLDEIGGLVTITLKWNKILDHNSHNTVYVALESIATIGNTHRFNKAFMVFVYSMSLA